MLPQIYDSPHTRHIKRLRLFKCNDNASLFNAFKSKVEARMIEAKKQYYKQCFHCVYEKKYILVSDRVLCVVYALILYF